MKKTFILVGCTLLLTSCSGSGKGSSPLKETGFPPMTEAQKTDALAPKVAAGALTQAILSGKDPAIIATLLRQGADPNEKTASNRPNESITPLIAAVALKNSQVVKLLLDFHANRFVTYQGYYPVELAEALGDQDSKSELEREQ